LEIGTGHTRNRPSKRKCSNLVFADGSEDDLSDVDYEATLSQKQKKRWKISQQPQTSDVPNFQEALDSENTTSNLDRSFTSSRKATKMFGTFVQNCGANLKSLAFSHSTVHRRRIENREKICERVSKCFGKKAPLIFSFLKIFNEFNEKCGDVILSVHWDGKKMSDTTNCFTKELKAFECERMAVLVSGVGIEKILGIPKLDEGTGKTQAENIFLLTNQWNISKNLVAMSFDTTSSNTGECFLN
jgi:hypothetical protein